MPSYFTAANEVQSRSVEWLWEPRIPLRALTIVEGDPGDGKSTLCYDLASRVSRGREMPDCIGLAAPAAVIICQGEEDSGTVRAKVEAAGADLNRVLILNAATSAHDKFLLPSCVAQLETATRESGAKLVILDPIANFIEGSMSSDRAVRAALSPLLAMAERTGAAVVLVRHLNKGGRATPLYRGAGSISLVGIARASLVLARDPVDDNLRVLAQVKSSFAPRAGSLSFRPMPSDGSVILDWLGPSKFTADQFMASIADRGELYQACQVLFAILFAAPVACNEALRQCHQAGILPRTARRAKELMGVESKRHRFGPGGHYVWSLPSSGELTQRLHENFLDNLCEQLFTGAPDTILAPNGGLLRTGLTSPDFPIDEKTSDRPDDPDDDDSSQAEPVQ